MKKALLAVAAVLALVLTASALGDDFSQGNGANATANWKVLSLGAVSDSWNTKGARAFDDGIGFAFGADPPSGRASRLTVDAGIRALKARIEWADAAMKGVRSW